MSSGQYMRSDRYWMQIYEAMLKAKMEARVDFLEKAALRMIQWAGAKHQIGYGWSGGKESVVIAYLCERAGITDGLCVGAAEPFECSVTDKFIADNIPKGCEHRRFPVPAKTINERPELLFHNSPLTLEAKGKEWCARGRAWWLAAQWDEQHRYAREHRKTIMIWGRRVHDGNYCGPAGVAKNETFTALSPMHDWNNMDLLAFLYHRKLVLPPHYDWGSPYHGWTHGPLPWPELCDDAAAAFALEPVQVKKAAKLGVHAFQSFLEALNGPKAKDSR